MLVIPEPLFELSGQHVLAMRYVGGTPLRELESADDATRQQVAVALALAVVGAGIRIKTGVVDKLFPARPAAAAPR